MPAKKARDRLIRWAATPPKWVLGYADEVWWSRLQQPRLQVWTPDTPLHLEELTPPPGAGDPKALACYGLLRTDTHPIALRFVAGRPVSALTIAFLEWLCQQLQREGRCACCCVNCPRKAPGSIALNRIGCTARRRMSNLRAN